VPRELTVDNWKQFDCQDFREYCCSIRTKLCFASVYHPQSNGAVERANRQIFSVIKKCLFEQKGKRAMSYQGSSGHTTPQSQELLSLPRSDYCMGPKQWALKSSPTKALEFWWVAPVRMRKSRLSGNW
jgi:transposase InsO family protein